MATHTHISDKIHEVTWRSRGPICYFLYQLKSKYRPSLKTCSDQYDLVLISVGTRTKHQDRLVKFGVYRKFNTSTVMPSKERWTKACVNTLEQFTLRRVPQFDFRQGALFERAFLRTMEQGAKIALQRFEGIVIKIYRSPNQSRRLSPPLVMRVSVKSAGIVDMSSTASSSDAARAKKLNLEKATNFMRQFRDPQSRELKKLSANQFMEVWSHYDKDGNGYIEGTELDGFLREFVSSANATDVSPEAVSDAMLVELKQCFMEAYDDNQDGKIDIRELAQLLPMEENFLLLFRFDNPLESSVEFMKIWREYDLDGSGYIEADELKIMFSWLLTLLPVKENFLCRQIFKRFFKA
uniref:EF-hand domain-containing protein n=1 Tax=Timema bartmani TaxID=61472 RepID=A0A7R9ETK1_9NEOP|nr:unnamed protein product [Timema bartmani]